MHGYLASTEEVMAIIRRMDMDADARLSKYEFIEGIKPEEPYSKAMKRSESKKKEREYLSDILENLQHSTPMMT